MNTHGMTLVELAQELTRRAAVKRDFVVATPELGFAADDRSARLMIPGAGDFGLTDHAHSQLADRLMIPKRYYDRLREEAPALLTTNVLHWFRESPERRMVRTLDGTARAFLSDRYHRLDNEQIAEAVLPLLVDIPDAEIVSCAVTAWKLYIQVRFPRLEGDVQVGDPVQSGVTVRNGEIGNGALTLEPLIFRLRCTNGLIVGEGVEDARLRRSHLGRTVAAGEDYTVYTDETRAAEDRALLLKLRDSLQTLAKPALFRSLLERLRQATQGPPVVNPVMAVEELGRAYPLPQGERTSILTHLIQGGDYTRWGLLNAVTATTNAHDSYDRAIELQELGGKLLNLPLDQWQPIATAQEALAA